ncbi:MAG: LamG-like jellyroll fold domain-containing protein, partial [Planctomycetota bacterium]
EDGFAAYLNGQKVAECNAPGSLYWNSTADSDRPLEDSSVFENINLMAYLGILQSGNNVLAIHGLNDNKDDDEFLVLPELIAANNRRVPQYFTSATPGTFNVSGAIDVVEDVEFSYEHGFYDSEFHLTICTDTDGAEIHYTLDGSRPTITHGLTYTVPLDVNETSTIRAVAVKPGFLDSDVETRTYIFVSDVVTQSINGEPPGPGWPIGSVNGQVIDYGMDPEIVESPSPYADLIDDALLAVPTISIVTDLDNLFDSTTGIYVHAGSSGRSWERPCSVELLNPDGTEGFQINAGLRIRGGYSRGSWNPKHAFRLFFRSEYGPASLKYPLFEDEGVDEFENVDLRTSQNYSWAHGQGGGVHNTMVREVFSRDLQGEMGHPYTRSRYYHLYLNGHYWGLFQTQERSEASHAESYLGGDKDNYDVVKTPGMLATDGNRDALDRLYDETMLGLDDSERYYRVQGLNMDGTRNPNYEKLLDVDNVIDFMIIEYYTGDRDGPASRYTGRPNNTYGIYNRINPDGWKWFHHDNEHALGAGSAELNMVTPFSTHGAERQHFNPHWLHEQLANTNIDYRLHFADHVYKHFFNNGLLDIGQARNRIINRMNQIDMAIIAESARWGDGRNYHPVRTKDDDWLPELIGEYGNGGLLYDTSDRRHLTMRVAEVLGQFRSVGWYPDVEPPTFNQNGGLVPSGFDLTMSESSGTIWYTIDGNDPRLPEGGSSSSTSTTLVAESAAKRVLIPTGDIGSTWRGGQVFDDSQWNDGNTIPDKTGGVGYEINSGYEDYITYDVAAEMYNQNDTCYIRIPFTFNGDPNDFNFMTLKIRYDDGFIAYLNGDELDSRNFTGTPAWNSSANNTHSDSAAVNFEQISVTDDINSLRQGDNILAIHGLNFSTNLSDFLISAELVAGEGNPGGVSPSAIEYITPVTLTESTHVMARVLDGITWSALNEAIFAIGPVTDNLRITEMMYHPLDTNSPDDPNAEFIELTNIGPETINISLARFTEGIRFTFPSLELTSGEFVLLVKDRAVFDSRYTGVPPAVDILNPYEGRLANGGERIRLEDAIGQTILDFEYKDGWRPITDGDGFSLTIIEPNDSALYPSDESLVAHWKFDDGSGPTAIDSAGINHGILKGDSTWTTGRIGGALSFDGDEDYVSLAPIAALAGDTLTAQAWIRVDNSGVTWSPILVQHNSSNEGYFLGVSSDRFSFYLIGGSVVYAISPDAINVDQWYHVSGTNDGSDLKIHVDGSLKASMSSVDLIGVDDPNAYIGYDDGSSYSGLIDDVRIYNRPLTEGEFQDIADPMKRWSRKDSWRASDYVGGSPGEDTDILPNPGAVIINEVMAHSHGTAPDWIELYNTTGAAIDISGWYLSDNDANLMKYRIADGTTIAGSGPNRYLVFYEDQDFNDPGDPGCIVPFKFSENGEEVCLSSAEGAVLTGYREVEDFGASERGISFGRYFKSSTGN